MLVDLIFTYMRSKMLSWVEIISHSFTGTIKSGNAENKRLNVKLILLGIKIK